ncbi:MAG: 3-oxoacyl-ACP reductase [Leptospiraceae bacterium]|nr:MAG: 3-oxoacyl-ACP reductase [Leptospiraceae bacterium]
MNDILLEIEKNPLAKQIATTVGIPLPPILKRYKGPWKERILEDKKIQVGGYGKTKVQEILATSLLKAGAQIYINPSIENSVRTIYEEARSGLGGIFLTEQDKYDSLVFDATNIQNPDELKEVYYFFHNNIRKLGSNGRIVIIAKADEDQKTLEGAVCSRGLEGFTRSIAKEIGKKGSTANIIYVRDKAEDRIEGVLRFLLSELSAFIDNQVFRVSNLVKAPKEIPFHRSLDRKNILITGAARGIGEKTAELIAQEGANVILVDHPMAGEDLGKVAERLNGYPILADLMDPESYNKITFTIKEKFGKLDGVVHNAGITRDKTIANMKEEQWDQVLQVNLKSILGLNQSLLDNVLEDYSHIVCLSSISGIAGNFGQTNYSLTKAALIGFVKHLSEQVAKRGITVNAVAPGFIETKMTAVLPLFIKEAGRRLSNLSQGGLPEDVGQLITFLMTPGSYGITGQVIRVCGGALIGA